MAIHLVSNSELKHLRRGERNVYDEVDCVVNTNKKLNYDRNVKYVPELSPELNLSRKAYNYRKKGYFNQKAFDSWYVNDFISYYANDKTFISKLIELTKRSKNEEIALACFCKDESMCHRSILRGILKRFGANINCSDEYLKYFYKFLNMTDLKLSARLERKRLCQSLREANYACAVLSSSDGLTEELKTVLDGLVEQKRTIALLDSSKADVIKQYLDSIDYDNVIQINGHDKKALLDLVQNSYEVNILSEAPISDIVNNNEYLINSNVYLKLISTRDKQIITLNEPESFQKSTVKFSLEGDQKLNKTDIRTVVKDDNAFSQGRVDRISALVDLEVELINKDNVRDIVDLLQNTNIIDIVNKSYDGRTMSDSINFDKFYTTLHNEFMVKYDAYKANINELSADYDVFKSKVWNSLFDKIKHNKFDFTRAFSKEFEEYIVSDFHGSQLNLKPRMYEITVPYGKRESFNDVQLADNITKESLTYRLFVEDDVENNEYKVSFASNMLNVKDESHRKKLSIAFGRNTITLSKREYIGDSYTTKDNFGNDVVIDDSYENLKALSALVYLNSKNPDLHETEPGRFVVRESVAEVRESDVVKRKRHFARLISNREVELKYRPAIIETPRSIQPEPADDLSV